MIAGCDSNIVIGLAKGGVWHLLVELFPKVYVSSTVFTEICIDGAGRPGDKELKKAIADGWVEVVDDAETTKTVTSDDQVAASAKAVKADYLLTGDVGLKKRNRGISTMDITDILVVLHQEGHLNQVRPVMEQMKNAEFHISEEIEKSILDITGE